jgi:hypothetical protein
MIYSVKVLIVFNCRVISYKMDTGFYEIQDADDCKKYNLPESQVHSRHPPSTTCCKIPHTHIDFVQVLILDLPENTKKLSKGETVYAVYPDTTAFYMATVSQVPF